MDDLIAALEAGPGSRELSDRVLVALGWRECAEDAPGYPDGTLTIWRRPDSSICRTARPDCSRNLQDAVDLVPDGMFGSVQFGCERLPATDTNVAELCGLKDGRYGPLCEAEAPTPALALCIAILRSIPAPDAEGEKR